jgi:predicted transposase/invertase (TIGR01784 family)
MAKGMAEGMAKGMEKGMAKGMAQGLEKGMAQGLSQGKTERNLEIAQKMKSMGLPIFQISESTGLSLETIEQMK